MEAVSGIYAGGPVYRERGYAINELKNSGFTNLVVWTIHIESDGSLGFNGEFPLVEDGVYIGDQTHPNFRSDIASLKTGNTSITRVEFGLSAAGSGTYDAVRDLLNCQNGRCQTDPSSILYRNFQALKEAFPSVDAVNNDDESEYHVESAAAFHIMLADIGFKTAIVPYTRQSFWRSFVNEVNGARPGTVDALYLQNYAGGSGNNPCSWDLGIPVYPGLWSRNDSPSRVESRMRDWNNRCGSVVEGGFMWLYDDFDNSPSVAQYAQAINNVFGSTPPPPSTSCSSVQGFESGEGGWQNSTTSSCSTGAFVVGRPTETTSSGVVIQAEGAALGNNALFTATNSSAGTNDVDGGVCIVNSPIYSVDQESTLSLRYFHGQRDTGDDAEGDYFRIEVSTDGGNTFQNLVGNGDTRSSASWLLASRALPANSNVVVRVLCSDGASAGDLVECGIDDVRICSTP
ncbi:hypothetical protein GCM10007877_04250 [Marinibactrum halimedae]|uniref:MAM domain-containing protein n=1 Tax=Marinibactrum halimedae TaxID=1444977 RepID=A0AA37WM98_9GAMM|nr:hypothetical protein GCM10007877_04250 [Marinibactrum halimedae]